MLVTTFRELRAGQTARRQGDRAADERDDAPPRRSRSAYAAGVQAPTSAPSSRRAEHVAQHLAGTAVKDEPEDLKRLRHYLEHEVRSRGAGRRGRTCYAARALLA